MSTPTHLRFLSAADPHPRGFGSDYDPILHGVASGLGALFPPIDNARRCEAQECRDEMGQGCEGAGQTLAVSAGTAVVEP
ncbi:hypothetical protein MMB17_08095 [Methylobacterium organophilum]|uniref:hypothetical protein n=1 Tax=Methylobacterium organophilum TaxID=410 RepID=UPI001F1370BF|nr:hypothetical protein [Methylobacterium organophilum]UMY19250.1 hypothetical protein MMB17_08095 [Methylobacterium organophilum]